MIGVLDPDYRLLPVAGGYWRAFCKKCSHSVAKHGNRNTERVREAIEKHLVEEHGVQRC